MGREQQKEVGKVRRRWLVLKEQWENGHSDLEKLIKSKA
jgi:hypothetical protein